LAERCTLFRSLRKTTDGETSDRKIRAGIPLVQGSAAQKANQAEWVVFCAATAKSRAFFMTR
jgi:hypothetical protein